VNYAPGASTSRAKIDILDGRVAQLPGWEECGFELVQHASTVSDWDDDAEVAAVHYAEVEELARKMTNADHALVSSHIKRSPEQAKRHQQLSPITFAHSDFAAGHDRIIRGSYRGDGPGTAAALQRNGLRPDDVENATRIVILQFWRNLGAAKMDYPLAWCDVRTVTLDDGRAIHVTNYAGTGATFDALAVMRPSEKNRHQWYAFPELRRDEAVAFRTYDTDLVRADRVYFTPHAAFRDPDVEVGNPARSSIELRATCVFG
jgi:hypothetical protein